MAKHGLIMLFLIAQIIDTSGAVVRQADFRTESSLRIHTSSSMMFTFPEHIWNNTMSNLMQREIQLPPLEPANRPMVNKLFWLILAAFFGMCGLDRCYLGQICCGCVKLFTLGGFSLWAILDYVVCIISALRKDKEINIPHLWLTAVFEEDWNECAFWTAIVLIIFYIYRCSSEIRAIQRQRATQDRLQTKLEQDFWTTDEQEIDIPRRHQSLAYMPSALTRGLRQSGFVQDMPTIPELIAAFDKIDKDGDGTLDRDEMREAMGVMGVSDETIDAMIKSADTDGDGKISQSEFLINAMRRNSSA